MLHSYERHRLLPAAIFSPTLVIVGWNRSPALVWTGSIYSIPIWNGTKSSVDSFDVGTNVIEDLSGYGYEMWWRSLWCEVLFDERSWRHDREYVSHNRVWYRILELIWSAALFYVVSALELLVAVVSTATMILRVILLVGCGGRHLESCTTGVTLYSRHLCQLLLVSENGWVN